MKLPVGTSVLFVGLVVALAGSFTDNVFGDGGAATVLQVVLWTVGGVLILAGAASATMLRAGERGESRRRTGRGLRPTVR